MKHYRETGNTPILERAVECLGYMQLHFQHKIPKFYFKEIADEVLTIFREYVSSGELKTSCIYVLFTFTSLKYPIFEPIFDSVSALVEGFQPLEDCGVVEQGIIATIRYLCKKLSPDETRALSTTSNIQKLIWILNKRLETRIWDGTLDATIAILLLFTEAMEARLDFVNNYGVSYIALLLQMESVEKQGIEKGLEIMRKMAEVPRLRKQIVSSEGFLDCLKEHGKWKDIEYADIVLEVMGIVANILLLPKSDWEAEEDQYEIFEEKLKSYSKTEWTKEERDQISSFPVEKLVPFAEQEDVEVSRLFAVSVMLRLCQGSQGQSYKYRILEDAFMDYVTEAIADDSDVSEVLKKTALELNELLTTNQSTKL